MTFLSEKESNLLSRFAQNPHSVFSMISLGTVRCEQQGITGLAINAHQSEDGSLFLALTHVCTTQMIRLQCMGFLRHLIAER